jgi:NAD(P) transhydrogenase subunit beta
LILDMGKAQAVIVLKRGMKPCFAGVEIELYSLPRTMPFGDAKDMVGQVVEELEAEGKRLAPGSLRR